MTAARECQRTLCLYKPGAPMPDVKCAFHFNGSVPCTGRLVCMTCGREQSSTIPNLDDALREASVTCFASDDLTAHVYGTTGPAADLSTGEAYLVFRGDDGTRHHLKDEWRECYSVKGVRS